MFEVLGGFVVKFLPADANDRLRACLSDLAFDRVNLDGAQLIDKAALHAALYREMNLAAFAWPFNGNPNWDSLSDLLWQWVMSEAGHEVTKLAFVIENGSAFQTHDPQLAFQFAETCIQLQTNVRRARERDGGKPLLVRVVLVG